MPPPTITSPPDVDVNNQIVAGMSEPNSIVTIVIDLDNNPATTNDRVTYRVTADSSGHWSLNIKTATPVSGIMPVGGLALPSTAGVTATASDNPGNTSSATRGELRVRWLIYYPLFIEVN